MKYIETVIHLTVKALKHSTSIHHVTTIQEFLPVISPVTGSLVSTSVLRAQIQFIMVSDKRRSLACSAGD